MFVCLFVDNNAWNYCTNFLPVSIPTYDTFYVGNIILKAKQEPNIFQNCCFCDTAGVRNMKFAMMSDVNA